MQIRGTNQRAVAKTESAGMARLQWLVRKLSRRDGAALALPLSLALLGSAIARERDSDDRVENGSAGSNGQAEPLANGLQAGERVALMTGNAVLVEHLLTEADVAAGQVRMALRMIDSARVPGMRIIESADTAGEGESGSASAHDLDAAADAADAADAQAQAGSADAMAGEGDARTLAEESGAQGDAAGGSAGVPAQSGNEDDDDRGGLLWLVLGLGAVGTGIVIARDGGNDHGAGPGPGPGPGPDPGLHTISGQVIKGYVQGAAVYLDLDHDGLPDGDPVYTDADGRFTLQTTDAGASIVVYGGVDTLTNVPLEGLVLRAPAGSTVVTPLTTLLDEMLRIEPSLNASTAQARLLEAFGLTLPAGADLRTYDAVAGIANGGAPIEDQSEVVLNTISAIQSLLTGAGASGDLAAANTAVTALAQAALESTTLDLTDAADMQALLQSAFTGSGVGASDAADLASLAGAIAAVNGALTEAAGLGESALQATRYAFSSFQDLLTSIGAGARSTDQYDRDISFSADQSMVEAVTAITGGSIGEVIDGHAGLSISFVERLEGGRFVLALNPELKFHEGAPDTIDTVTVRFDVESVVVQLETRGLDGQITAQTLTPDANGHYTLAYRDLDKIFFQAPEDFNGVLGAEVGVHYVGLDITDTSPKIGIRIDAVNDAPASADATVSASEDERYVFGLSDFPFSDEKDASYAGGANELAAVRIASLPESGTLYLRGNAISAEDLQGDLYVSAADIANGLLSYVSGQDGHGDGYASFQFQVRDDGGTDHGGVDLDPAVHTMTVNVAPVSDAPEATGGSVSVREGGEFTFAAGDFGFADVDGDDLTGVIITSLPQNGTLHFDGDELTPESLGEDGEFPIGVADLGLLTFVPDAHYNGPAEFSYKLQDGGADGANVSGEATLSIAVSEVSDAPVPGASSAELDEDGSHQFSVADFPFTDADGNSLAAVLITSLPTEGELRFDGDVLAEGDFEDGVYAVDVADLGKLVYVPGENYDGSDSIGYRLRDSGDTLDGGANTSDEATFALTVNPVSDAPVATSGSVELGEDGEYTFQVADFGFTDVDGEHGDALAKVIVTSLPTDGTLYFNGTELTDADIGEGGFAVAVADMGQLKFAPNENYVGSASFGYEVQDTGSKGLNLSQNGGTLSITVNPVSDAPEATSGSVELDEDGEYTFQIADFGFTDIDGEDGDALAGVIITSLPADGTLRFNGKALTEDDLSEGGGFEVAADDLGLLTFVPDGDYAGLASFGYKVRDEGSDGANLSDNTGTLSITVKAVSDAPEATSGSVEMDEDGVYTFQVADFGFSDIDGDALAKVIITSLPENGVLKDGDRVLEASDLADGGYAIDAANLGNLTFVPDEDYAGDGVSFDYKVQDSGTDGANLSDNTGTLSITVKPVSDAPEATSGSVETDEDTPYAFSAEDFGFSDIDGDALAKVIITSLPENGVLKDGDRVLEASDLAGGGYAIDAADLGDLTFVPDENYAGDGASFDYKVQDSGADGANLSDNTGTLSITVKAVSDAPEATSGSVETDEDTPYAFSAEDFGFSDIDGDALAKVIITSLPENGVLKDGDRVLEASDLAGGGYAIDAADLGDLTFVPDENYAGDGASFDYKVQDSGADGANLSDNTGTLSITVKPVSDAPEAAGGSVELDEDGAYTFQVSDFGFSDIDGDALAKVIITSLPENGVLKDGDRVLEASDLADGGYAIDAANLGNLTFVPDEDYEGDDTSFGYKVQDAGSDGLNISEESTMDIVVNAIDDAPVANNNTVNLTEDHSRTLKASDFAFTDADGHGLDTVFIMSLPGGGVLKYDGVVLTDEHVEEGGYSVSASDIAEGKLVFTPAPDENGTVSFDFKVKDAGASDDDNISASAATLTLKIKAVNDDPTFAPEGRTFEVTTLADAVDAMDGVLSLREALALVKDGDRIAFAESLFDGGNAIIELAEDKPLQINASVYINGAYGEFRVILATDGSHSALVVNEDARGVVLSGLSIDGGGETQQITGSDSAHSALVNSGGLTLNDFEISGYDQVRSTGGTNVISVLVNNQGGTLDAFGLKVHDNSAAGGTAANGGSAYLIQNSGLMRLVETELTGNEVVGGSGQGGGTGGSAYLIVNIGDGELQGLPLYGDDNATQSGNGMPSGFAGNSTGFDPELLEGVVYEAPTDEPLSYMEGDPSFRLMPKARIGDVELDALNEGLGDWSGASVTIEREGGGHRGRRRGGSDDDFGFIATDDLRFDHGKIYKTVDDIESVIGAWTESRGKLVITFKTSADEGSAIPTTDDVDNVLRQVTYRNTSDNPAENVTLAVTVKDGNIKWNGAQGQGGEGRVVGEITVGLVNVNDAPEARRNSVRIDEDGCHTFDASDFRFKDAEGDDLKAVIITNLPTNGTLYYCDEEITAEQLLDGGYSIKACDLDKLTFKPDEDFHGKVTFKYMLQDAGGTDNDGEDTSGKATFEIKVRSINDDPTLDLGSGYTFVVTTLEDVANPEDGFMSLRKALELAQDDDSIGFSADLVGRVLELDGTPLEISSSVYIDGMIGEDRITLKTDGSYTAISVTGDTNSGAGVILSGLIIQGGETEKEVTGSIGADSAIVNLGALTLSNVEVTDYRQIAGIDSAIASVLFNGEGAALNASDFHVHQNVATGSPENSAYLIYNGGTMDLGNAEITGNAVFGGLGLAGASGGDAYLIYAIGGAQTIGSVDFGSPDSQTTGGDGIPYGAAQDYSGGILADSVFEYQPPEINMTPVYIEGEAGVLIAPNATIADPELDKLNGGDGDWSGASIEIARKSSGHRGRGGKDDDFGFAGNDDLYLSHGKVYKVVEDGDDQVIGTWSESSRGKLTITFKTSNGDDALIPTNEDVNNILRQVTYQNESDNPKESVILTVTVKDGNAKWNGEQGKGGEGRVAGEIVVQLVNVNDAPDARRNSIRLDEDECYTFGASDFRFKDAEDDDLKAVIITGLPAKGTLYYCGEALTEDDLQDGGFLIKDCNLDKLTFKPDEDFYGKASFQYKLQDAGGTENDGDDTSREATFKISIRSVNDDPELALPDYASCVTPEPLGGSWRVNKETDGSQEAPRIAALADGGYVVVWTTKDADGDFDIYARRYSADGKALGKEFQVNVDSLGTQSEPTVVATPDGGFTIVWRHYIGTDADIRSRSYDADGCADAEETVNDLTGSHAANLQFDPAVAATADGMVVVWTSKGQDGSGNGVYARVLVDGEYTDEFLVNTTTNSGQDQPSVTVLQDGSFVITWTGGSAGSRDVFSRHYSYDDGELVPGQEVLVNTLPDGDNGHEPGNQYQSTVTALSDGGYVIVWTGETDDLTDIFAQRYDAEGNAVGHRILVNAGMTELEQLDPAVVALPTGGFMVTWTSWGQDESATDVYAQRFGTDGYPLGELVQVNSGQIELQQSTPAIAVLQDGTVVVAWQSNYENGGDNYEIHAQRFELMKPYFIEGSSPVLIAPSAVLSDVELDALNDGAGNWTGATLVIQRDGADEHSGSGWWNWFFQPKSPDHFTFQSGNGYEVTESGLLLNKDGELLGRFVQNNGKLTIEFGTYGNVDIEGLEKATPTTSDVNHVLQSIGYWNSSDDPGESVTLKYRVEDGNSSWKGEQGKGGEGETEGTLTVKLVNVNDAPEARSNAILLQEDKEHSFDINDFRFRDAEDDDLKAVIITGLPVDGALYYCGKKLTDEDFSEKHGGFRVKACDLENLTFVPNENFYGQVSFQYKLQDDGGTERGGLDTSDVATFKINVLSINDAPDLTVGYTYVVTTLDDTICDDGQLSLREALLEAKDGDSITFASNLLGKTINLAGSPLEISENVYINGNTSGNPENRITLKTDGSYTAINVTACVKEGMSVILSGLAIEGDDSVNAILDGLGSSAAIVNAGALTLHDIEVSGYNQQAGNNEDMASVLWNKSGATLHAEGLNLHGNSAEGYGDVANGSSAYLVYNQGSIDLVDATIKDNDVKGGNGDHGGSGGNAYLIFNEDGAYFAVGADMDVSNGQVKAGTGGVEDGQEANYYLDPECYEQPPLSEFSYTAPNLDPVFTEAGDAIRLLPNAVLFDAELNARNGGLGDWSGASVTIGPKGEGQDEGGHHGGGWLWDWWKGLQGNADDGEADPSNVLGVEAGHGLTFDADTGKILKDVEDSDPAVIGTWSVNDQGALVITFQKAPGTGSVVPTTEDVNNVLKLVTYKSTSQNPEESVTFGITVKDGNGFLIGTQGLGGEGKGTAEITVTLNSVNNAPELDPEANLPVAHSLEEDQAYVFSVADFDDKFTDVEDNGLGGVVIWTPPTSGTLIVDGRIVTEEQVECGGLFVSVEDIAAGLFVFQPQENQAGAASFTYKLRDDGGTEHGGEDTTADHATFMFDMTPVNDAPKLALSPTADYTFVVTTLDDSNDPSDGKLSLREALAQACDGDSITFDPSLLESGPGTIKLHDTLVIDKQVYINGTVGDARIILERDECLDGPIVEITCEVGSSKGGAVLQGLVLDGDCVETTSAALVNAGNLTLHEVTITDQNTVNESGDAVSALWNLSGGVLVATDLEVADNSATAGDGGHAYAILNEGKLTADGLLVEDNTQQGGDSGSGDGGDAYALWNAGTYYEGSAEYCGNSSSGGSSSAADCGCEGGSSHGSSGNAFGGDEAAATGFDLVFKAPALTGERPDMTLTYVSGADPVLLTPEATLSDVELDALRGGDGNWEGARIEVRRVGGPNENDVFGHQLADHPLVIWNDGAHQITKMINDEPRVIATFTNAGGVLAIQFTGFGSAYATNEDVNYILQQLTYSNSADESGPVDLQFTVRDGNADFSGKQGEGAGGEPGEGVVVGTVLVNVTPLPLGTPLGVSLDEGSDSGCSGDGITNSLVFVVTLPTADRVEGNVIRLYADGSETPLAESDPLTQLNLIEGTVSITVTGSADFDLSAITARLAASSTSSNESEGSAPYFVTYDTEAPDAPVLELSPSEGFSYADAEFLPISGTAEAFSKVTVTIRGMLEGAGQEFTFTTNADASGRFLVPTQMENIELYEELEVEVVAQDRAGNTSAPAITTLTLQNLVSADPIMDGAPGAQGYSYTESGAVKFSFQSDGLDDLNGRAGEEWFIASPEAFSTAVLGGSVGQYTITLLEGEMRTTIELSAPGSVIPGEGALYLVEYWAHDHETPTSLYLQANAIEFSGGGSVRLTEDGIVAMGIAPSPYMIHGGDGNDRIVGAEGVDVLFGHDGNNVLVGGEGNDILVSYGMADAASPKDGWQRGDVLIGGDGNDILIAMGDVSTGDSPVSMYGGCGVDTFAIAPLGEGFARDITIHDFVIGEDRIDLSMLRVDDDGDHRELTVEDLGIGDLIADLSTDGTMAIDLSSFVTTDGSAVEGTLTVTLAGGGVGLSEEDFIFGEGSPLGAMIDNGYLDHVYLNPIELPPIDPP